MKHLVFTYEVLRQFMFQFLIGGYVNIEYYRSVMIYYCYRMTIYTGYTILVKAHEDGGNPGFSSTVEYYHFRSAWYAFLSLIDINFSEGFQCTTCGNSPQVIIMDATGLSFRRELDFWKDNLLANLPEGRIPKGR